MHKTLAHSHKSCDPIANIQRHPVFAVGELLSLIMMQLIHLIAGEETEGKNFLRATCTIRFTNKFFDLCLKNGEFLNVFFENKQRIPKNIRFFVMGIKQAPLRLSLQLCPQNEPEEDTQQGVQALFNSINANAKKEITLCLTAYENPFPLLEALPTDLSISELNLKYVPLCYIPASPDDDRWDSDGTDEWQENNENIEVVGDHAILIDRVLGKITSINKLERLNLHGIHLQNEGLAILSERIRKNTSLKKLDISYNEINYQMIEPELLSTFFDSLKTTSIEHLDLSENFICERYLELIIDKLKENTTLKILDISYNAYETIDDNLILKFGELFTMTKLTHLCLSKGILDSPDVAHLKGIIASHPNITVEFK